MFDHGVGVLLLISMPLSYVIARFASHAFFQEKYNYHLKVLRNLHQTEEFNSGKPG